jgi:homospermidine synthase
MQEEFLGIIFKEFNEMESKVIKIIAGTKEDIISKKILDENLMILDIGFSNKAKSCGLIINDDFHEELTFSDAKKKIIEFIKNNNKLTINLVIEASLSITFDKKGNPKGRKIEKEESKTRYWYYGAASTVTLATMELIKAISILRIDATVRLFEGFISFKEKDSKNNKNGHLNDAQLLKNTIENPKEGSVIEENNNKMSDSDVLKSSFDVMGLNVGVPAVIIGR